MEIRHIFIPSVYTNCYVLADESSGAAAVVDPGGGDQGVLSALSRLLTAEGLTLTHVLLTHGHFDHVGGVAAVCEAFGGETGPAVCIHAADFPGPDRRLFPLARQTGNRFTGVNYYADGDRLSVGTLDVEVLHTPGHTKGSVCLRCQDALFTGDTLFAGSCGRTDLPGGSAAEMTASLRRLAALEGDCRVYPGHESFTTLDAERKGNPCLRQALEAAP